MKFVTFLENQQEKVGLVLQDAIYDLTKINSNLPATLIGILADDDSSLLICQQIYHEINRGEYKKALVENPHLLAPIPHPSSFRDAYAFRQHVETSRLNRGLEMIPEFDQFPVFYFSNHQAIQGPGKIYAMEKHFDRMDFELEVAIVIKKEGMNITAEDADDYIGGFMILNDLSARALQMEEMKLNLGPAKGKDFASMFGPYLVTPDEMTNEKVEPKKGHIGNCYDLEMTCAVNGIEVSRGNFKEMHWTFAEIIERISYGVKLYPGDIIGSGTVGTGCFLELNGTGKRQDATYREQWLQPNDSIEMSITGLGKLVNSVHLYSE
ncbi:fumarylacetoacetate hydrolase family protein [Empedobacter brevis]|uniref:Fumarylacetoacetate hydrolase family protein n=1 Tax=Empedobacter brevis TaxID=247 RepID=A0AAJ1QCB0_9FLAO|nr:fumarylacetoacetate hydrolase family protein [Empedobacter brevis]MDM1071426.1 fumarylacetoacetate hydrolase family protein [Empedobacter brevis]